MRYRMNASRAVPVAALAILLAACGAASSDARPAASGDGKDGKGGAVVAKIGEVSITQDELDKQMRTANPKAVQEYYDAQRQVLEGLINSRILEAEAGRQGMTLEELQQKIVSTAPAVTDADVEKFYNENQSRMGQQSLDAMRQRIRDFLENQGRQQALGTFLEGERTRQGVAVTIEPPRIEVAVAQHDPYKGPAGAQVTIVEFSDFQ